MADPDKQAAFVSALLKKAEEAAAKNPTMSDMTALAKALVAETRTMIAGGERHSPLGAYMGKDGGVSILNPETKDPSLAIADLLLKLRSRATEGDIRAAALCEVLDKQTAGGTIVKFIQVHMEHVEGKAFISAVPADESVQRAGVPGVDGPAVTFFGGRTKPKIFPGRT